MNRLRLTLRLINKVFLTFQYCLCKPGFDTYRHEIAPLVLRKKKLSGSSAVASGALDNLQGRFAICFFLYAFHKSHIAYFEELVMFLINTKCV